MASLDALHASSIAAVHAYRNQLLDLLAQEGDSDLIELGMLDLTNPLVFKQIKQTPDIF